MSWWFQFPASLRRVVLVRLIASIGAGGVLYLTPLVFHHESFSASSVTEGVALAALAGTLGRFASGALLDRGRLSSLPVLLAVAAAMAGDLVLLQAHAVAAYGAGQLLLGLAMGLYWPAIELAVRLTAGAAGSPRGYALARTADALGIASGALTGALLASAGCIRGIYLVDLAALTSMAVLLCRHPFPAAPRAAAPVAAQVAPGAGSWLGPLLPILLVSLVATAVPALMQSALPLDLVRGSLQRAPMPEGQLASVFAGLFRRCAAAGRQWFQCPGGFCFGVAGPAPPGRGSGGVSAYGHPGGGGTQPPQSPGSGDGVVQQVLCP